MQKNGYKLLSINQYRGTDLFVFALILAVAEILTWLAAKWFPYQAVFTFSLMLPISLTVMMRWGWPSVFYPIGGGLLVCLLASADAVNYACYIIGNACVALMLIPTYLIGRDKIRAKWWSSALYVAGGWLCMYLGRSFVYAISYAISPIDGGTAWSGFAGFAMGELLSLVMGVIVVMVLRRLDGMFEDQKSYLKRLDAERAEMRRRDEYGDEPMDIDEDTMSILKKHDGEWD